MKVMYKRCCGIDIHKKLIVACLWTSNEKGERVKELRNFDTMTDSLLQMLDWLKEANCEIVAMESTGVFWKPLYNIFEGEMEVWVVNAAHMKAVPGRKTDVKDAEWIGNLLQHGLLRASFIPPAPQRELRDLTRYRSTLVADRAQLVNRVHKLLEDANIKLASVAADIMGVSGRKILTALGNGETNPEILADLAQGRLREKLPELAKALKGNVKVHHRFMLKKLLGELVFYEGEIAAFTEEIGSRLGLPMMPPPEPWQEAPKHTPKRQSEQSAGAQAKTQAKPNNLTVVKELPQPKEIFLSVETERSRYEQALSLLDTIPGVNRRIAEIILAEVGLDMSRFPSAAHLASWAGVCPGHNESGGKRRRAKTNKGDVWLRQALVEAANSAMKKKDSYFESQGRRITARSGRKKAVLAVAHTILRIVYFMLLRWEPYKERGGQTFSKLDMERSQRNSVRKLESLGFRVELHPIAAS